MNRTQYAVLAFRSLEMEVSERGVRMPQTIEAIDGLIRKHFSRKAENLSRDEKTRALDDLVGVRLLERIRKRYYQLPSKETLRFRAREK